MKLFDVYSILPIEPVKGEGCYVYDTQGRKYLDLYGGHAVISIGHSHPRYVQYITEQLNKLGFYSNSVVNTLQERLAEKLGAQSGYPDYSLFMCNSGAEANENALKLASFHTGRTRVLAFKQAFHGRTSLAVAATDELNIQSPANRLHDIVWAPLGDIEAVQRILSEQNVAAVIVEGIQGVGGINESETQFYQQIQTLCKKYGTVFILDEVQSGYARSGRFFAHQWHGVRPDLITIAKGMGNGFPVAGVLIAPRFEAKYGILGTTFGGNHLACAASLAVLETIEAENLTANAASIGEYWISEFKTMSQIKQVRGRGLMIGLEFDGSVDALRKKLLFDFGIFTGAARQKNIIRLLPPLNLTQQQASTFVDALRQSLA